MGATPYSGYYQEPTASFSAMGYPSEYGQDTRQTQGYGQYNPNMMYPGGAQGAVYDTNQQFPSRQAAGLQMMSAEVATPYFPSEQTNAAAAAVAGLQPQTASSSTSAVYQQNPSDPRVLQQSYESAVVSGMAQAGGPDQVIEGQEYSVSAPALAPAPVPDAQMGEAYEQYQGALREVFTNIHNGALHTASESLLGISEWLLTKVVELGLTGDDESLLEDRLTLWQDFNHAWLSLFQKQKDMLDAGSTPRRNRGVMTKDQLTKMGNELVRLCNGIERHGLVDYQYGVWEERIVDILHKCLDVYESNRGEHRRRSSHRGS